MKKINKYLCLLIAGIVISGTALTSCESMLKEKPYDFVEPKDIPDTDEGADMWTTGVYEALHSAMFRYGLMPRPLDYDCDYITGATWQFDQFGNGNFQGDNNHADALWNGMYTLINRANSAISEIEKMTGLSDAHRQNVLGECYFLKGWAYFYLVRAYGDIPVLSVSVNESENYTYHPRIPIEEVYTETIIPLLKDAKDMLYKNTDGNHKSGRVSAATAAGLLAKVYATIGSASTPSGETVTVKTGVPYSREIINNTWTKIYTEPNPHTFSKTQVAGYGGFSSQEYYRKAYDLAKDVVINQLYGSHKLEDYNVIWSPGGKNSSEHLFSLQAISGSELYGTIFGYHYCGKLNEKGNIDNSMTVGCRKHWYLLFEEEDYRIDKGVLHCWVRESDTGWGGGSYYPNFGKWHNMAVAGEPPFNDERVTGGWRCEENGSEQFFAFTTKYLQQIADQSQMRTDANYPFLRFADVVLILAEAANELELTSEAVDALNSVRIRSNATPKNLADFQDKASLRSAIIEERAMEFALEGDRRWDLIRWGIYLQAMNALGGTDEVNNVKERSSKHLLFPIPTLEILTNTGIDKNNDGWR